MTREECNFFLQQADRGDVFRLQESIMTTTEVQIVEKGAAQTLLMPVSDPVTGGSFYAGEVLVTSSLVRVGGENGWGMVMDDEPQLATAIAILDGAWAANICRQQITALAVEGRNNHQQKTAELAARVEETRVSFDLL